ncbi:hypothetical protein K490DRAFT_33572 [Saccharata proteae CBS 121410]|uniref:Uncharacterized protein n=1 Tax=Saccharata proteae CBS 121410 TaxID=1314787 RepID=A0A9P4LY04_9PEZI|nr:hypothetical protein K490DRAFT_33572 [Saccharata proteae CBS 121410]
MCYQVVERYAVCRCLYHKHSVDPCSSYGQYGHPVQEKTVLVGYACSVHSASHSASTLPAPATSALSDSGYFSADHMHMSGWQCPQESSHGPQALY